MQLPEENIRINITLSRYNYNRLKLWSKIHGRSPAAFAAQIVAARIEANFALLNEQAADYAKWQKQTLEEIIGEDSGGEEL
ncbi:hypothetical protein [Microseira wollei]|uniref:CopG domain protein DNA-binding domain protein n=1 Tax=Microseira wollei NIES-4236 TaxID=2530354 RepID=A0AAV3XGK0_9CYAN|nr:hypothetical protein [Microseira wollei]GET41539.1 hypothetical protein MiSe_63510 [Microseira wollei NIES-4236]